MKFTTRGLVQTGLLLAVCIASQFFKNLSVYLTGPIVNTTIILAVLAVGLWSGILIGVIAPVSGLIQAVGFLLGFDVPWVSFQFGSWTAHPLLALPLSILFGILFMLAGKGLWKITLKYIQVVSRQKNSVITGYN